MLREALAVVVGASGVAALVLRHKWRQDELAGQNREAEERRKQEDRVRVQSAQSQAPLTKLLRHGKD